ncbi:hypothetical protein CoNPh35_CDS0029 [Staphylococcus phage S-CoN_Ph35]|nr:hypothetical protein CoNPh35_CDS0029 [Staphylococcus phage S-CoN_Ph35]
MKIILMRLIIKKYHLILYVIETWSILNKCHGKTHRV